MVTSAFFSVTLHKARSFFFSVIPCFTVGFGGPALTSCFRSIHSPVRNPTLSMGIALSREARHRVMNDFFKVLLKMNFTLRIFYDRGDVYVP